MNFLIVGINHQSAPVALREKVAFSAEQLSDALTHVKNFAGLDEVCILSTCNRTEIYLVREKPDPDPVIDWLCDYHQMERQALSEAVYCHKGKNAVGHIMSVASGLDSMVVGETQILGQMKDAFAHAAGSGTLGARLNHLSQNTFRVAKKVRTQTAIGENNVSVASTAVNLAAKLFADLSDCKVLLIGAGDTIDLVSRHLIQAGIRSFIVANRTLGNAEKLAAEIGGRATDLSSVEDHLLEADLVFSSTASQLPVLGKGLAERVIKKRKHRPIFMVDLAVPRDIEPEIASLPDIYLYTIDDLQHLVTENRHTRQEAATEASGIIAVEVEDYHLLHQSLQARDLLVDFREKHESIKNVELEKALQRIAKGEDPGSVLAGFANQLLNKIMHRPSIEIKKAAAESQEQILQAVQRLYDLDPDQNHRQDSPD